jgi:hypothetical protein
MAAVPDTADPAVSQHQPDFRPLIDMPPDEGFVTQLLLMRAHLWAGLALYDAGVNDQAVAHCSHPLEELYDDLAPQLDDRGLAPFGDELHQVVDALRRNKPQTEVVAAFGKAAKTIDKKIASVDGTVRNAPRFVAAVATGLLQVAASEYGASLTDGKVANIIDYQGSRAFLEQARLLVAGALAARNGDAFAEIQKQLDDLDRMVPPQPPADAAVVKLEQVAAAVDRVSSLQSSFRCKHC